MMKEQTSQSPSVVCIHMNVDNKAHPGGKEKPCVCHEFCNTHHYGPPTLPGRRRKRRKRMKRPNSRYLDRSRSSESASSASSSGVLWQGDIENSKPKESASYSTSPAAPRETEGTAYKSGILREDPPYSASRPKSRKRRHKTYSRGRNSRSDSQSASSTDNREATKRLRENKPERRSPDARRNHNVYHRKHTRRDKYMSRRSRKHRRPARSKSPIASSRSSSRSYSDSDISSVGSASDVKGKQHRRRARNMIPNIYYEDEYQNGSERKRECIENYCHNTFYNPELPTVELINTIGIVNDGGGTNFHSSRGHTTCLCKQCENKQHTSPACLVSRCYVVPSSSPDHPQRMSAANCAEFLCLPCHREPCTRDDISHRKTHRHKSGRKGSPERREGHGHGRYNPEKKGVVDRQTLHSCNCTDCIPKSSPHFYQCSLLLGQCCPPATSTQCVMFGRDNLHNHTHNRCDSNCSLHQSLSSDTNTF